MLLPTLLWFLSVMVASSVGFECKEQTHTSGNSCHCEYSGQSNYKYDIFCPYVVDSKVHFKFTPEQIVVMTCSRQSTLSEVMALVSELDLGNVPLVKIRNCPVPVDPLTSVFSAVGLNVTHIETLQIQYVPRDNTESLQGYHFQNLTNLKELNLDTSRIKKIDKTFFEHITQIKGLDLTQNRGIQIDGSSFSELKELVEFTCHSCFIQNLEGNLFSGLTNLRSISLHDNKISEIRPGTFDTATALERLTLNRNRLRTLPSGIFKNNINLTSVNLSYNNFSSLPSELFKYNTKMKLFRMDVNGDKNPYLGYPMSSALKMTLPGSMFPPSIEDVKFLWVPVTSIPSDLFRGCENLTNVTMQSALITELPENLFQDTPKIKLIDFSANSITKLPARIFRNLNSMEKIRFIANQLTTLDENLFVSLEGLKVLHLHENQLVTLPKRLLSPTTKLEELDLSKNKLVYVTEFTEGNVLHNLKKLDLSFNNITDMTNNELQFNMLNLRTLNLSHNSIDGIVEDIHFIKNKIENFVLDLSYNSINRIVFKNPFVDYKPFQFIITNNPLICDCEVVQLKMMIDGTLEGPFKDAFRLSKPDQLKCGPDNNKETKNKYLNEVDYRDLYCNMEECSDNCRCSFYSYIKETHMDCSNQNMDTFPSKLVLHKDAVKISLNMNNNRIQNVTYAVDRFRKNQDNEAEHYKNITKLYLSHNMIKIFHQECLPPQLEELYLDNNQISMFRFTDINYFDVLSSKTHIKLKLSKNPYACDCNSKDLYHFVRNDKGGQIIDRGQITINCEDGEKLMWKTELEDFCVVTLSSEIIGVIIGLIFLLFIAFALLIYCYKQETIVIWVYAQPWGKVFFSEDLIDKEKPYDAFISYSQTDSDYVENSLLPGLENPEDVQHKFKCLIHTRDWNVGEMIPDQIIHSVESSRRTIIVLSKSYIDSMWTKLEFRAAHKQALQDRTQRVIIVVLGELPKKDDMEEDLQKYISLNTYLDSEDPWFWQKLRFALPHRGGRVLRGRTRRETDKLELMRSQAELELGKRTPSPKNLDPKTLLKDHQYANGNGHVNGVISNGFANGQANGHAG